MTHISYLSYCLNKDKLIRWPDNCMPLKVYISPLRWYKAAGDEYSYYAMIKEAFEIWKRASAGKISYEFVTTLYNSNINIEWKRVERSALGTCQFNYDNEGRLFSAEIHIGLSDGLIHKEYEDKNEVLHTIIHEVGHALGLGHSPYPNDIMYVPHQYGVVSVSKNDMMTFKWLYKFPYGLSQKDILAHYNLSSASSLDHIIYLAENAEKMSDTASLPDNTPEIHEELLHKEQKTLAELGKYNIAMQNINVSSNMQEYFQKIGLKKDLKKD